MPKSMKKPEKIDWGKLAVPEAKEKYLVEVSNKYEALSLETDEQVENNSIVEKKWNVFKNSIIHANESAPKIEKKQNKYG